MGINPLALAARADRFRGFDCPECENFVCVDGSFHDPSCAFSLGNMQKLNDEEKRARMQELVVLLKKRHGIKD